MKFQGVIGGNVEYEYHIPSGRYYAKGTQPPTHSLIQNDVQDFVQELVPFPLLEPKDAFGDPYDNNTEVPF